MKNLKRKRARAIIYSQDKMVMMYREYNGRTFYTFPGGGMEEGESEEDCVVREVYEEFGLKVKPRKKVYIYENEKSYENFYICDWISGELGSGKGEEFQAGNKNGVYINVLEDLTKVPSLTIMPPEVAEQFCRDFSKNGKELRDDVLYIEGKV